MWETLNVAFWAVEILLAALLVFVLVRKSRVGTMLVAFTLFLTNLGLYLVPVLYARLEQGVEMSLLFGVWKCIAATIKQFVGEVNTDAVRAYAQIYPSFIHTFSFGAALAIAASFSAAISVFGSKIKNAFRFMHRMSQDTCDLVCGMSDAALNYAREEKNVVLFVDEGTEKDVVNGLLEEGFVVFKQKFSEKLLKSKRLNSRTHYNFILLNDEMSMEPLDVITGYVRSGCVKKKIRFYVEVNTALNETMQNRITYLLSGVEDQERVAKYRESITLFSRNELIARKLVEQHPMTRALPHEFLCADASVAPDARMQAIFLGMTPLSREIYKQFVINHQFSVWNGEEYRASPLSYEIYDETVRSSEWEFGGLERALMRCKAERDAYFSMPEMPYHTVCHNENPCTVDVDTIAEKLRGEKCHSFVFIDTGDPRTNLELANRLRLRLRETAGYHLFVYDPTAMADGDDTITEYGNERDILAHEVIVNESLTALARSINREYCVLYGDCDGLSEADAEAVCEQKWYATHFFKRYSNVSLANNLRLKLNLLGLDYVEDGAKQGIGKIGTALESEGDAGYFVRNRTNALLAQEHYRWNAYHMMNGYLPMKKEDLTVSVTGVEEPQNRKDLVETTREDKINKYHICLTDFRGLDALSCEIAQRAKVLFPQEAFSAADFDFYQNDKMLLSVAPKFFEEKNISVVDRT